jgi:hypothetical protein
VVLSVAFDIIERHRAAVALKQSEKSTGLRGSFAVRSSGNDQGRYMDVNRAATRCWATRWKKLLGLGISMSGYHQTKEANP